MNGFGRFFVILAAVAIVGISIGCNAFVPTVVKPSVRVGCKDGDFIKNTAAGIDVAVEYPCYGGVRHKAATAPAPPKAPVPVKPTAGPRKPQAKATPVAPCPCPPPTTSSSAVAPSSIPASRASKSEFELAREKQLEDAYSRLDSYPALIPEEIEAFQNQEKHCRRGCGDR